MASATTQRRMGLTGDKGIKAPVQAATTGNITLSAEQTIGGVAVKAIGVNGYPDRVLVWNQTNPIDNGIWDVSTGAWTRSLDANGSQDLVTGTVGLIVGGIYSDQFWILTSSGAIAPGSTALQFQVGIPSLPILAAPTGAGLVGWIRSAVGAIVTTVAKWLGWQIPNVFEFMTDAQIADVQSGSPVLDHTAAVQNAFTAAGKAVRFPEGTFRINGTLTKTTTSSFRIYGAGMGVTIIRQYADADLFSIGNTGSGSGQFTIENMTLEPRIAMTTGAALSVRNDSVLPSLRVSNVFIGISSTYEFKYGIKAKNCTEAIFDRVIMYGLGQTNFIGWQLTCSVAATVPKWSNCSVYNAMTAVDINSSTNPGIEGVQFYGCDFVGVKTGVLYLNSFGAAYFPPQVAWFGGHINSSYRNFDITTCSQFICQGALLYNSGSTGQFIRLSTVSDMNIQHNTLAQIAGACDGIIWTGASGPNNGGIIANNTGVMSGANFISLDFVNLQNLRVTNNTQTGAAETVHANAGTPGVTTRIIDNYPKDAADISGSLTGAATMSLVGQRSNFMVVGNVNVTCTALTSRNATDVVTLKCDGPNLKLQHNGTNPDGFLLKGALDFTFSSGSLITLQKANGGYWTELSRSV